VTSKSRKTAPQSPDSQNVAHAEESTSGTDMSISQESLEGDYNSFPKEPIYRSFRPWMRRIDDTSKEANGNVLKHAIEMAHDIESRLEPDNDGVRSRIIERVKVLSGETISYSQNIPSDFVTKDWKLVRTAYIERKKLS